MNGLSCFEACQSENAALFPKSEWDVTHPAPEAQSAIAPVKLGR
jgi:hypothetical protein